LTSCVILDNLLWAIIWLGLFGATGLVDRVRVSDAENFSLLMSEFIRLLFGDVFGGWPIFSSWLVCSFAPLEKKKKEIIL
jgi:hypothetical protein